jgi:hypothetical protein
MLALTAPAALGAQAWVAPGGQTTNATGRHRRALLEVSINGPDSGGRRRRSLLQDADSDTWYNPSSDTVTYAPATTSTGGSTGGGCSGGRG